MAKSTPYRACPHCGSNLDPGERSDCMDRREAGREAAKGAAQPATKTAAGNTRELTLMPGA